MSEFKYVLKLFTAKNYLRKHTGANTHFYITIRTKTTGGKHTYIIVAFITIYSEHYIIPAQDKCYIAM